jgi:hypothetical protein
MRSKHARRVLLAAPLFLTFTAIALAETVDIPPLPAPTVAPSMAERIEPKATILFPAPRL